MSTQKGREVRASAAVTTEDSLALPLPSRERAAHSTAGESVANLPPTAVPETDPRRRAQAEEIKQAYREGIVGIVKAGIMLRGIKEEMLAGAGTEKVEGYREFRLFCERDLGWPKSQVNRLIDLAAAFGSHLDLVIRFDLSAMYSLSRAPQAVLEQALQRARNGEFIPNKLATDLIRPNKGGKVQGRMSRSTKDYAIPIPDGAVVVAAPHRTLAEVRVALQAALEVIDARIAKRRRVSTDPSRGKAVTTV